MSTQKMVEEIIHVGAVELRYTTQELGDLRRLIIEIPVFGEPMSPEIEQGDSGSVCVSCMGIESTAYFLQTDELVVVEMCPAMNRFASDVTRKYPIKILSTELDEGLAKSSVFDYNGGEILFNKAISNGIISETIHCPIISESILVVVYHSMVIDVIKVDKRFDMLRGDITDIENMWTAAARRLEKGKTDKDNTPVDDDVSEDFPITECEIDNEVSEFWESIHNEVFRKARRWYVTNRIASMIMDVPPMNRSTIHGQHS